MSCNSKNGKTYYNALTPFPASGTDAATKYLLDCTHYTCGNRQMCVNSADGFPLASNFDIQVLGNPRPLDNDTYCCDIRCICDLTYEQVYRCGNGCPNSCLQTEKVIVTRCIPCPSADVPIVTALGVSASPIGATCGCPSTNMAEVEFAFTVESGASSTI